MSVKSLFQIVILLVILMVLGSVYFNYFLDNKVVIEESNPVKITNEKKNPEKLAQSEKKITTDQDQKLEINNNAKNEDIENNKIENETKNEDIKNNNIESEKTIELSENKENSYLENENKLKNKTKEKKIIQESKKVKNLVKDVEYLTTDRKGNRYRILATSGRTNLDDNNVLDLDNVRGVITSETRPPIYIVSDFAEYNSSNLNSKFYQNVVIDYLDKQITCDNFDIDMETNTAIAYNNVIVTDPKSKMTAGVITLDIETKDIIINPETYESKVKVITN